MKLQILLSIACLWAMNVVAQDKLFTSKDRMQIATSEAQIKACMADSIKQVKIYKFNIEKSGKKIDSILVGHKTLSYKDQSKFASNDEVWFRNKMLKFSYTIEYNKNGSMNKSADFFDEDRYCHFCNYHYDDAGELLLTEEYNKDTSYVELRQRFYDQNHLLIKIMRKIDGRGKDYVLEDSLLYDPNGKLSEKRHYYGKKYVSYLYEYTGTNDSTVVVTEQNDVTQHVVSKDRYSKNGLLLSSMSSPFIDPFTDQPDGQIIWKYYYNKNGTINTCIRYHNGKVDNLVKYYYTKE